MSIYKFNKSDLYIVLWLLYYVFEYMQWPSAIQIGILGLLYAWSFYCAYLIHTQIKVEKLIVAFDILIAVLTFYFGVYYLEHGNSVNYGGDVKKLTNFIFQIYSSLLTFYAFYWFSMKGNLSLSTIRKWSLFFFAIAIWDYFIQQQKGMEVLLSYNNPNFDMEIVNNGSYKILALIPLIGVFNKKIWQLAGLIVCLYFILMSFKRGPLLIMSVCVMYYYIKRVKTSKIWTIIALIITVYAVFYWIQNLASESEMFVYKMQKTLEGNSSGRDILIVKLFDYFSNNLDPFTLFFGFGANATIHIVGKQAHSDWVEMLINLGLFGLMVYSFFCYQLTKFWKKVHKNMDVCIPVGLFCIIYLLTSVFSMAYDQVPFYEMLVFAYFAGNDYRLNRIKEIA